MNRRGSTYFNFIKKTEGNSLVENVIVLPLIFLCIYFIIIGAFFVHDKITLDAAVERGAV
ncbi:MAG: pilus assembly protein, partial [Lachnospiraceae bacterium]|nr:pilus assembly protein [Lachnospiraceae bacterium]